jgi:hypothetical protein
MLGRRALLSPRLLAPPVVCPLRGHPGFRFSVDETVSLQVGIRVRVRVRVRVGKRIRPARAGTVCLAPCPLGVFGGQPHTHALPVVGRGGVVCDTRRVPVPAVPVADDVLRQARVPPELLVDGAAHLGGQPRQEDEAALAFGAGCAAALSS